MTGVGFFSEFNIPEDVDRVPGGPSFKLGDVNGTAMNVEHGLGFLLHVTDGVLRSLEGYTYDECWPNKVKNLSLTYSKGRTRDLLAVREIIKNAIHGASESSAR
jgi:hypothetical protein